MVESAFWPRCVLSALHFETLEFPSDGISIRQLRRRHPDLFDTGFEEGSAAQPIYLLSPQAAGHVSDTLGNMLFLERMVVANGYALERDLPPPKGEIDALKEELADLYVRYGLADDRRHAAQRIDGLEAIGRREELDTSL